MKNIDSQQAILTSVPKTERHVMKEPNRPKYDPSLRTLVTVFLFSENSQLCMEKFQWGSS